MTAAPPSIQAPALSRAVEAALDKFHSSQHPQILTRARALAAYEERTLMAQDVVTAARLLAARSGSLSSVINPATAHKRPTVGLVPPPPPSQQIIPLAPGRRPLMPFKTLMWALYRDEDYVAALIGDRKLISFNIASTGSAKQHLVIWVVSIVDFLASRPPTRADDLTIIDDILPGQRASFRARELAILFNTGTDHINNLIKEGNLEQDQNRKFGLGAGMSRHVLRESLVRFLKNGRVS